MSRQFVVLCILFCCLCAGCQSLPETPLTPRPQKSLLIRGVFDTSSGSGVSPASSTSLVDAFLPEVIHRRGTVEYYTLDDVEGVRLIGRFSTGSPARKSQSVITAFERDRLLEAKRSFLSVRDTIFESRPRASQLALALTVLSMNVPKDTEVRYIIASDAREWSSSLGVDMECKPPSINTWNEKLKRAGLLQPGSLKDANVIWVGVRPLMAVPGNRCPADIQRMNQTRTLWETSITNAGGRVTFVPNDTGVLFPSMGVLVFFGGGLLAWRKRQVRNRAKEDKNEGRYAFKAILIELLGPIPGLDPNHPLHQELMNRLAVLRPLVDEQRARIRNLREDIAQHVRWSYLASGTILSTSVECWAWIAIFIEAGLQGPGAYLMGIMTGIAFLVAVMFAVKHAEETGNKKYFVATIIVITIIVAAATTIRVKNALSSGGDLWEELPYSVLVSFGALGPAFLAEYLMRHLRPVMPKVRLRKELKKQLRENSRELTKVTKRLSREAELRRAWEWEYDVLKATYDGINPDPIESTRQTTGTTNQQGDSQWT